MIYKIKKILGVLLDPREFTITLSLETDSKEQVVIKMDLEVADVLRALINNVGK